MQQNLQTFTKTVMENTLKSLLKPHPKKFTKGGLKSSVLLGQWLTYGTQRERPLGQGFIYVTTWKEKMEKKRKSLKERGGLSSGWSLKKVLSHQGGCSSGWSLIRSLKKVLSHQGGLSSGWLLIRVVSLRVVSHQGGLSPGWSLLGWSLIRVVSQQSGLSTRWSLIRVVSHQCGIS